MFLVTCTYPITLELRLVRFVSVPNEVSLLEMSLPSYAPKGVPRLFRSSAKKRATSWTHHGSWFHSRAIKFRGSMPPRICFISYLLTDGHIRPLLQVGGERQANARTRNRGHFSFILIFLTCLCDRKEASENNILFCSTVTDALVVDGPVSPISAARH